VLKSSNGSVIDWVSYTNSDQEWPDCPKYCSIELSAKTVNAQFNNYGSNWNVATTAIAGTNCYGTPGY
jgi:hypothetical protein